MRLTGRQWGPRLRSCVRPANGIDRASVTERVTDSKRLLYFFRTKASARLLLLTALNPVARQWRIQRVELALIVLVVKEYGPAARRQLREFAGSFFVLRPFTALPSIRPFIQEPHEPQRLPRCVADAGTVSWEMAAGADVGPVTEYAVPKIRTWSVTARWIFPVEAPPMEGAVLHIQGKRIAAIEPHGYAKADRDLGNVAILPGLVNAHTHLDLSYLSERGPAPCDFTDWLRAVVQQRRMLLPEEEMRNVFTGLNQSTKFGTTLLGDIARSVMSVSGVALDQRLRGVVFDEVLGLPRARAHEAWARASQAVSGRERKATYRPGLSPHAPYSVRASVFRAAARFCQKLNLPLAIHLAETREELELLEHQRGPFVSFLSELGAWDPKGLVKGVEEVLRLTAGVPNLLFIHGNYLNPDLPFPRGASVIYCPRTHAFFGHPPHPFRELMVRGIRVALGTDSRASNPDLDMLAEARFLHRHYPDVPPATILRMITLSGAEALGWQDETGSLAAGKSADLCVLPLPAEKTLDPHELILSSSTRVQAVLFRGRWLARKPLAEW
jgi:cytosine/adenosine deaminase-related metal-dependent hydrolase